MRIYAVLGLTFLACAVVGAADDPFVGTWKLDVSKSQSTGIKYEIKSLGGNKYEFIFGDDKESIVADGSDQPSKYGGTWAVKQDGPDNWTEIRKHDGKVTSTDLWTFSDGGKKLVIEDKGTRPDGSSYDESLDFTRQGSGQGLAGVWISGAWKPQSDLPDWVIKPNGDNGLSFTLPAEQEHLDLKFDGKEYPDQGPRVAPGSMTAAKRVNASTIVFTDKLKGKFMDTTELKVSDDGKTLTMTMKAAGVNKPMVSVYEKQ